MKTCSKCEKQQPTTNYHKKARSPDGLSAWCKTCKSEHAKKRSKTKTETPEERELRLKKKRCHRQVETAVRNGSLVRPDRCEGCHGLDGKLEGHHTDYDRPLEVVWLCKACHMTEHGGSVAVACICGRDFVAQRSSGQRFCSTGCYQKSRKEKR